MKVKLRYILLFVVPALVFYTIFVVYPIGYSFNLSFFSWPGVGEKTFVGFENFKNILFGTFSEEFFSAVWHSFLFFVANSIFELGLAFIIAIALTSKIWGRRFFQTMVYLPNVISMVLVGFIWSMMLNPQWGLINSFLKMIGLENLAQPWLGQPETALPTVIMVNVWRNIGFYILVFMAAILNIPKDLFEAAYIDGAKNHHIIRKIIFPLVVPNMQTLAILIFIWSFNIFDVVYALEGVQAGPFRSTDVLGTLFYRTAFGGLGSSAQDYGLGAAVVVIIFVMVIPLSMVYANILDKRSREA
ncbi:MAG TPA: sugar ABC transporter permease [Thermotogota bacterium]|nr:sugar ABC transporter permease [Thermotogota bacterium]HPJ89008.1 sugar ABC transporter permease [Thermotogota bacterium]HPR95519.1 sugar ABC transporter permease [Thermotogota bacterium]